MAPAKPLRTHFKPLVVGYKRISGGNIQVTWSIAPAKVVRRTVPVEAFNPATIATLTEDIERKYTTPEEQ